MIAPENCAVCADAIVCWGQVPSYCSHCGADRRSYGPDHAASLPPTPRYPLEWRSGSIQRDVHTRAAWRCEHCETQFRPGDARHPTLHNADGKPRILTVHHLDGNPANCDWTNLVALCQTCHLHVQAVWKPGGTLPAHWPQPPGWITIRGLPYVPNGQLSLWEGMPDGR